eukprot:767235-Hanusia_phi.AAC.4
MQESLRARETGGGCTKGRRERGRQKWKGYEEIQEQRRSRRSAVLQGRGRQTHRPATWTAVVASSRRSPAPTQAPALLLLPRCPARVYPTSRSGARTPCWTTPTPPRSRPTPPPPPPLTLRSARCKLGASAGRSGPRSPRASRRLWSPWRELRRGLPQPVALALCSPLDRCRFSPGRLQAPEIVVRVRGEQEGWEGGETEGEAGGQSYGGTGELHTSWRYWSKLR